MLYEIQRGVYRSVDTPRLPRAEVVLPPLPAQGWRTASPYPRDDRDELLEYIRDSRRVHFTDTTCRDATQSNTSNRFRLAEDAMLGPYLDGCGFFSLENGGGAQFHVIGAVIMTHGDARGLVLPPVVAPTQVVIVPIAARKPGVNEACEELRAELAAAGVRVVLDNTDTHADRAAK